MRRNRWRAKSCSSIECAGVARLPVEIDVAVPVREFRVRSLLALEPGQVIESQWVQGDDCHCGTRRATGLERV